MRTSALCKQKADRQQNHCNVSKTCHRVWLLKCLQHKGFCIASIGFSTVLLTLHNSFEKVFMFFVMKKMTTTAFFLLSFFGKKNFN